MQIPAMSNSLSLTSAGLGNEKMASMITLLSLRLQARCVIAGAFDDAHSAPLRTVAPDDLA